MTARARQAAAAPTRSSATSTQADSARGPMSEGPSAAGAGFSVQARAASPRSMDQSPLAFTPGESVQLHPAEAVQFDKPKKTVSPKAMTRLGHARKGIAHTKSVLKHGGGNQKEALEATNFNSYFRMIAMRDDDCWVVTPEAQKWADRYPEAMVAAKGGLAGAGNCGEHAAIAFDYLRVNASGDKVNRVAHTMDHAFVLLGDLDKDDGTEIVACDPWPTKPTACTWEDHFAFTTDPAKLKRRNTMSGDDKDVKALIAAGLKLSAKGEAYVKHSYSDEETKKGIEDGRKNHPPSAQFPKGRKRWIWIHANAATTEYEYVAPEDVAGADPDKIEPAPDSVQDPAHAADTGFARFLEWIRSWF